MAHRVRARLAWGVSLLLHVLVLGALIAWLETTWIKSAPKETPVPLNLAMLAATQSSPAPPEVVPEAAPEAETVETPAPPEPAPPDPLEPPPMIQPKALPEPAKPKPPKKEVAKPAPPKPKVSSPASAPAPVSEPVSVPASTVAPVQASAEPFVAQPVLAPSVAYAAAEDAYKALVRHRVDSRKRYPPLSRRMGEEGRVVVEFKLGSNGEVLHVRVKESSGRERLDEAALQAVREAASFPPFPDEVARQSWEFTLPLNFSLN